VFMSSSPLTGYDNTDAVTGNPDSQVFLYEASSDRLTCVSCNPGGARPIGPSTLPLPPARAIGNLQRGVSDDGRRVFFDSRDALVTTDVNGKADVYEHEDGAVHLISSGSGNSDSVFSAASGSGDDVFFVTRERLAQTDVDDNLDMYDARVGGGFARPASSPPCSGDACQGTATSRPAGPSPTSASVIGDGNASAIAVRPVSFRVAALSRSDRRQAARTGYVTLSVRVSRGGILKARASRVVKRRATRVGSVDRNVARAATVRLRMRLAKSVRATLARGGKVRLSVRISFSHSRSAKTMLLELQR
jgi:hypothetical protein